MSRELQLQAIDMKGLLNLITKMGRKKLEKHYRSKKQRQTKKPKKIQRSNMYWPLETLCKASHCRNPKLETVNFTIIYSLNSTTT